MLRLQLQTMGSGALHCRTSPPARHRARREALTAGSLPRRRLGMRDNVAACEPILRALAPPLAVLFLKLLPWRSKNRHTALAIRSIQMVFSAHTGSSRFSVAA